jgi:hypothetical protein
LLMLCLCLLQLSMQVLDALSNVLHFFYQPASTLCLYLCKWIWIIFSLLYKEKQVRFEVLTAMSMKMTVFWDVTPCSLVDID